MNLPEIIKSDEIKNLPENDLSVPELIDHIIVKHHDFLRKTLIDIKIAGEIISEDYENVDDNLDRLLELLNKFTINQFRHMQNEESVLFPFIKSLFESSRFLVNENSGDLVSRLAEITKDHSRCLKELKEIRILSNNYNPPEWAGVLLIRFYKDLEAVEKDLILHLAKENEMLHTKAIAREKELTLQ